MQYIDVYRSYAHGKHSSLTDIYSIVPCPMELQGASKMAWYALFNCATKRFSRNT